MAINNFSELVVQVKRYAKRSTLTGIGEFISLAEERIKYGYGVEGDAYFTEPVRTSEMIVADTLSIGKGDAQINLPAGFLEFADTPYLEGNARLPMAVIPKSSRIQRSNSNYEQMPLEYALIGNAMLLPSPSDADYTVPIRYYALPALDEINTPTNGLLASRPSIYLWATLLEVAINAKSKEAAQQNLLFFQGAAAGANRYENSRSLTGPLVIRTDGGIY